MSRAEIEAVNRQLMDAVPGDAAAAAALYTDNARVLPPNVEPVIGKAAIQELFQSLAEVGAKALKLKTGSVHGFGDAAVEEGDYAFELQPEGGEVMTDLGTYVVMWRRDRGEWKLDLDIWNSNLRGWPPWAFSSSG